MSVDDPKTAAIRTEIYRRMSGKEKVALAMKMREDAIAMVRDSIRRRRPDFVLEEAARKRDQFNVIHLKTGFKIDLWPVKNTGYDRQAFQRHLTGTIFGTDMEIISPEDVILSKLRWYREVPSQDRQLQDALEVLQGQAGYLDEAYMDRWADELGVRDLLSQLRARL